MLTSMQTRRVVRKLVRTEDGRGWQVVWVEVPQSFGSAQDGSPSGESATGTTHLEEHTMKKRSFFWSCLFASLLILILAGIGVGGWWFFFRAQPVITEYLPASPVLVFLLSPSSGDEVKAGDLVPVKLQATAPTAILSAELFADGQSLGKAVNSPAEAEWTWQAWPLGIHTLQARVTTLDGQVGESQTVIVNVLVGDGVMQVTAQEGQTLQRIGADFGLLPDQMAGANPKVNPSQPLKDGQPVKVPIPGGGAGGGSGQGGGQGQLPPGGAGNLFFISIIWDIKFTEPVDKSYCYTSSDDGVWEKMPKDPFNFFESLDSLYTQLIPPSEQVVLQVDCWGWLGGALKYLGQGKTSFDLKQPPQNVMLIGNGFQFTGTPKFDFPPEKFTGGGGKTIPPPFALRSTTDAKECASHANPLLAPFICDALLNPPSNVKEYNVLVWEWGWNPATCWPGSECSSWVTKVDGYRLYQLPVPNNPYSPKSVKYLQTVKDPQKVAAVLIPWGGGCYGVEAYVDDPAIPPSPMAKLCGESPTLKKITLTTVTAWLTVGKTWVDSGDCDTYGGAELPEYKYNQEGFGKQPGEVSVGSYIVDDDNNDCFRQGQYAGAVKFDISPLISLPSGAVIQKAELKYSEAFYDYGATGIATNEKPSCVKGVRKGAQDWTGLMGAKHYSLSLLSYKYYASFGDLAYVVKGWLKNQSSNYGLILLPAEAPDPEPVEDWDGNVTGTCEEGLTNFSLDVYYYAP